MYFYTYMYCYCDYLSADKVSLYILEFSMSSVDDVVEKKMGSAAGNK